MNDVFRIYINDDMVGVELCGAFKNVVALGAGILRLAWARATICGQCI